jgi:hypothetical protein
MIDCCRNHIPSVARSSRTNRPQMAPVNDRIEALSLLAWNTALGRLRVRVIASRSREPGISIEFSGAVIAVTGPISSFFRPRNSKAVVHQRLPVFLAVRLLSSEAV